MEKQLYIDLNSDLGESFGHYKIGNDEEIMKYVSSVNIACGFHAGDPTIIKNTVNGALDAGVAIGAHPGFPDLQGFGRRNMHFNPEEIYDMTLYQIGALHAFVKASGGKLHHVKPHGALYNMASKDKQYSRAIVEAVLNIDEEIILFGLSGSQLTAIAKQYGLKYANEAFVDRTYNQNGQLTPRSEPNSLIKIEEEALAQVLKMINEKKVIATTGEEVPIEVDTLCIHGDGIKAVQFAQKVNSTLRENNIIIQAL